MLILSLSNSCLENVHMKIYILNYLKQISHFSEPRNQPKKHQNPLLHPVFPSSPLSRQFLQLQTHDFEITFSQQKKPVNNILLLHLFPLYPDPFYRGIPQFKHPLSMSFHLFSVIQLQELDILPLEIKAAAARMKKADFLSLFCQTSEHYKLQM